jgi:hypothetical protein
MSNHVSVLCAIVVEQWHREIGSKVSLHYKMTRRPLSTGRRHHKRHEQPHLPNRREGLSDSLQHRENALTRNLSTRSIESYGAKTDLLHHMTL